MKYLLGSPQDFHNFVSSIQEGERVGIVTHTDVDGVASGILLQKILESKNIKIDFMEFLNYGAGILENLSERRNYDKLFFTDWLVDEDINGLNLLRKEGDVLVFDHHPLNEKLENKKDIIKTEARYCSAHALFDLAKTYFDVKSLEWLVCSAIIADYTFKDERVFGFLRTIYPEINEEKIFESEPGKIAKKIDNSLIYNAPDVKKVYDLVLKKDLNSLNEANDVIEKEVDIWIKKFKERAEYFPEKRLYFYYATPKYRISRVIATRVSGEEFPKDTIVFLSDKRSKKDHLGINSRNQTGNIKLGEILGKCILGFENSTAGGHDRAAGGDFPKKYLDEFKRRLLNEL